MDWISYHIAEEYLIALTCAIIAVRSFRFSHAEKTTPEITGRLFLIGSGFTILSISSALHATIHTYALNLNLLYQTLLGYCLGLLLLIVAVSAEKPVTKKLMPLLYLPLLLLLHPHIYSAFPIFGNFRPLVWLVVSYFSGVLFMLYIAAYYRTRAGRYLYSSLGHALICTGAIMLFFPASIGSTPWIYGHLLRPLGFIILFFSMKREDLTKLKGSILYKALTAFSLLAAIPLMVYGTVIFYDNITPISFLERNLMVFVLLLVTLASSLFFGMGLIIRLVHPILLLKDSVSGLVDRGLNEKIEVTTNDEIGELSSAYNEMVVKLREAVAEQDRLTRLATTGELSATLAHEIKNPLNAISGAASYLRDNYKGRLINEFTKIIQNEAARINTLSTKLLNFAKPTKLEPSEADINKLVQETALLLAQDAKERHIQVETDLQDSMPMFHFDYDQIKQVLLNIAINAFDALEQGGRIRIQTRRSRGTVTLSVEDNGPGIAAEEKDNIFNPFYTTKTRGTGLGLAVSKKIAKGHGGDLHVESSPSAGSKVTLILPEKT